MPQTGEVRQAFGELNNRLLSEARQHHVFQLAQLINNRGINSWIGVTKQVDPPAANAIQITLAIEIDEPGSIAAFNRNQRQLLMALHLGAGMPDGCQAAL